jgi:CTP:molybdopterin cytidylyltransferase MocA
VTVAAVILAASPESALRDVDGVPNVRRLADVAWAGGADPIVVAAPDPDGTVRSALAGATVTYAEPAPHVQGPVGQICRAIDVARGLSTATEAALVWPARMGWVDAETVTSLIEAHGIDRLAVLRPAYAGDVGWPALVPVVHLETLRRLGPERTPGELLDELASHVPSGRIELGDPGVVFDLDTPRDALPAFEGPAEPASGHVHEWGSPVADRPDDEPLAGPPVAPYPPPG